MAIVSHKGSCTQTLSQEKEISSPNQVNERILNQTEKDICEKQYEVNSFVNRTSINQDRYPKEFNTLLYYVEGSPASVTYFHKIRNNTNIKTQTHDLSIYRSPNHTQYLQINDFELRILNEFDYTYNPTETNDLTLTGEVLFYAGFEPIIGDLFLYDIGDRQYVVFQISETQPLTFTEGTCFKCSIISNRYATRDVIENIRSSVEEVVYFDKQKFLNGEQVLLSHDSYVKLNDLKQYRRDLLLHYINKFFDTSIGSFIRPDNVYDPYLVEFINSKIDIKRHARGTQLYSDDLEFYSKTIWYYLLHKNSVLICDLIPTYRLDTIRRSIYSGKIVSILGYKVVVMDLKGEFTYAISNDFYQESTILPLHEKICKELIITNKTDIRRVLDMVSYFRNLSDIDKFYLIPIYIHILDMCIQNIT